MQSPKMTGNFQTLILVLSSLVEIIPPRRSLLRDRRGDAGDSVGGLHKSNSRPALRQKKIMVFHECKTKKKQLRDKQSHVLLVLMRVTLSRGGCQNLFDNVVID